MKTGLSEDLSYVLKNTGSIWQGLDGKSLFITGGTGFFGKWLLESISFAIREYSLNLQVFVLSRNPDKFKSAFPYLATDLHFTFLKGDIAMFEFPDLDIDYLIHAATEASASLNHEQPLVMFDSIVKGTRNVLEFAHRRNIKRMLYVSSGAVYGVQPRHLRGFPEDYTGGPDTLDPASAYAEAKRSAELLCACYSKFSQVEIPVARCFAFTGPYLDLDAHFAIGNFIRNGINHENIIIRGDGKPMRSYMYMADLVIWLLHILIWGKSSEAYNVGSDEALTIADLAMKVAAFFPGLKVEVLNQVRPTDRNQNYVPDVSKFKKEFNLAQIINLEQAISKTIEYAGKSNSR